jgi:hypothetical protein
MAMAPTDLDALFTTFVAVVQARINGLPASDAKTQLQQALDTFQAQAGPGGGGGAHLSLQQLLDKTVDVKVNGQTLHLPPGGSTGRCRYSVGGHDFCLNNLTQLECAQLHGTFTVAAVCGADETPYPG